MRIISTTELTTHRRCKEEHHFSHILRVRPLVKAPALVFGTAWHSCQEAWWSTGGDLDAATCVLNSLPDVNEYERSLLRCMMAAYHSRWHDSDYEVLGVEVPFTTSIIHPVSGAAHPAFLLTGKIDAIVRDSEGKVLIVEHKTANEVVDLGSIYWTKLRLNPQISTYYAGLRSLGFEPAGCLYDVASKGGMRPYEATPVEQRKYTKAGALYARQRETDETPEEFEARVLEAFCAEPTKYLTRGTVLRTEDDEIRAAMDMWDQCEDMLTGRKYRNPDQCFRYKEMCPYHPVCADGADINDPTRFRLEPRR